MAKYYVGNTGTTILVETGIDLTAATVLSLLVKKPSGAEVTWTGTIGPTNAIGESTRISYVVETGDWDQAGWWSMQSHVETPAFVGPGVTVKFELHAAFR